MKKVLILKNKKNLSVLSDLSGEKRVLTTESTEGTEKEVEDDFDS